MRSLTSIGKKLAKARTLLMKREILDTRLEYLRDRLRYCRRITRAREKLLRLRERGSFLIQIVRNREPLPTAKVSIQALKDARALAEQIEEEIKTQIAIGGCRAELDRLKQVRAEYQHLLRESKQRIRESGEQKAATYVNVVVRQRRLEKGIRDTQDALEISGRLGAGIKKLKAITTGIPRRAAAQQVGLDVDDLARALVEIEASSGTRFGIRQLEAIEIRFRATEAGPTDVDLIKKFESRVQAVVRLLKKHRLSLVDRHKELARWTKREIGKL